MFSPRDLAALARCPAIHWSKSGSPVPLSTGLPDSSPRAGGENAG